jgi:hypothetical protein
MFEYSEHENKPFATDHGMTTGQLVFVKVKDSEEGVLILKDDQQNIYELSSVSLRTDEYSSDAGNVSFPKPFITDRTGGVIESGAKLLIAFPRGRKNPVIMGCINSLGGQYLANNDLRIDVNNLREQTTYRRIGNTYIKNVESEEGISRTITGGGYVVSSEKNIVLNSQYDINLKGDREVNLSGAVVNIKGSSKEDREDVAKLRMKNKADEINLVGKRVTIGHSDELITKYEMDEDTRYLDPRLQPVIMGTTLKKLLEVFVDTLCDQGIWIGSGTVRMSPTTARLIKEVFRSKLDKTLSKVGRILYDPEQVQNEETT